MERTKTKLKPNPRDKSNILSVLSFAWTIPLFRKGLSKHLEIDDICQPRDCDKSKNLADRLDKQWTKEQNKPKNRSLLRAVAKTFWKEYLFLGFLCLINDVIIRIVQPQLLRQFLLYFKLDSNISDMDVLHLACGMVFLNGLGVLTINQLFMNGYHNGMKVRVAMCSLMYRKALKLSHAALEIISPGKVINLMSNDVNRFDSMSMFINAMWTAPLLVIVVGYLLWVEVRWAGMVGLLIVFIVVPIQSYTGKLSSKYRIETAIRTDERVRFMDEIISGIQIIKLYAWEKPFAALISTARKMELKVVRKNSHIRALYMTFAMFTTRMALFCTLLSICLLYGEENITAAKVFVVSSYFSVVAQTMSQMFVRGVAEIAEGLVAFSRIQEFLENEEKMMDRINEQADDVPNKPDDNNATKPAVDANDNNNVQVGAGENANNNITVDEEIKHNEINEKRVQLLTGNENENGVLVMRNANARWIPSDETTFALSNINLDFRKKGKLIGVFGSIASGKSSFLQALLRELPVESGILTVNGSISYACQDPWVFQSSVRQNILFGERMDRRRYEMVVKACALEKDFDQMEYADRTLVGERGISLSGGQKARINLARSVYRKADIYLLDDPLSAVDTYVALHLFNECIGPRGLLAKQKATRILVTHQIHFLSHVDWLILMRDGKIIAQGSPKELSISELDQREFTCSPEKSYEETDANSRRRKISRISARSLSIASLSSDYEGIRRESEFDPDLLESLQFYEESTGESSQRAPFRNYFRSGAKSCMLIFTAILFILAQLSASGADYWVSFWISQEEGRNYRKSFGNMTEAINENTSIILSTEMCVYIYSGLIASIFVAALIRSMSFYSICVKASKRLHDQMFAAIVSTTMRFFHLNPSGRILNRFARDMGSVDELLPRVLLDAIQTNLNMSGAIILTAVVNPIFLIPFSVVTILFLLARNIYVQTSKNIKRLEGITRSPVYTHLNVSLDGLSTIRAFSAEQILIEEFDNHQDTHTACWFSFISASCAFGFALDILCFVLVFVVIFSFLLIDTGISADKVGLAITQSMTMTGLLQWGIRHSVEVTNQLISVERILEYSDLEQERQPITPKAIEDSWPSKGRIEFRNLTLRYFYEAEAVLHRISLIIRPKEKLGIVGRTGAGKSSLIAALFRMAHVKGEILIDDVDTASVMLQNLRGKISIIPQNPVLFSGTLRMNLDPFSEYSDADIYNALDEIKMRHLGCGVHGLSLQVLSNGSNFSIGQRQLLCLARAILRKNRILVLDEATANVDSYTDELIQRTIRVKFADCTVLTVAHRLHTIIDSDRILVIDAGKINELDTPLNLLSTPGGTFKEMVRALGQKEFDRLLHIAQSKENLLN